jgi:hypothetical protein
MVNTLPLAIVGGLTIETAALENFERDERIKNPPIRIAAGSDKAQQIAYYRLNRALDELTAATSDRHALLIKKAAYLFGLVNGGWPLTSAEVERGLIDACARNGYLSREGEHEIVRCINDMRAAEAIPLELHESKTARRRRAKYSAAVDFSRRVQARTLPSAGACTVRYVSDDLTPEKIHGIQTLLIQAGVGMGKTRAVADYANSLPDDQQVTGIAQFRILTTELAKRLKDASHYEDSDHAHQYALGSMARLVTSLSSLPKFPRAGGLVSADEIEGDLQFLAHSDTFKDGEAITAFRAFKDLVTSAYQFTGMDANLSDITIDVIRRWRGEVTVKRYVRPDAKGKVRLLNSTYAAFHQIGKLLAHRRGQVYAGCSAESTATDITDWYCGQGYRVLKITRDTSNTQPARDFIANEHGERGQYDLVVYTSAMGAGVDISEDVYALVGIFDRNPLPPENAIQLFGRVRNARRYYAAVPPASEGYITPSADDLLADKIKRECWTAARDGREAQVTGDYLELLQLWSQFEARRLKETARWRHYFTLRLAENGYTVSVNPAKAPQTFIDSLKEWKQARSDANWEFVQNANGLGRSDDDLQKLRMAGVEITRELRLSNIRYKVERALGHDHITDLDRDLMTGRGRRSLFRLSDLFTDETDLMASDRQQAAVGRPLQKRSHKTLNQRTIAQLLRLAGFAQNTPEAQFLAFSDYFRTERPGDEITERFEAWAGEYALRLFKALAPASEGGHHGNNARTVVGLCRWLLEYFGLKLTSIRRGRAEDRYMAYVIDLDLLDYCLARARHAAQERAAKDVPEMCNKRESTFLVHASDLTHPRQTPPGEGWQRTAIPAINAPGKAFIPSGTGASKINPFSKAVAA